MSFHNLQITAYFTFWDICTRITLAHRNLGEIITESKFQINQYFSLNHYFDLIDAFQRYQRSSFPRKGTNCHNQTNHLSLVSLCITLNWYELLWITLNHFESLIWKPGINALISLVYIQLSSREWAKSESELLI